MVETKGNIVQVVGQGRTLMRNVSHLKKLLQRSTQPEVPNIDPLPMLDAGQSLDPEAPPSLPTPEEDEPHNIVTLKLVREGRDVGTSTTMLSKDRQPTLSRARVFAL